MEKAKEESKRQANKNSFFILINSFGNRNGLKGQKSLESELKNMN